jgi:subtilisin family serine protease
MWTNANDPPTTTGPCCGTTDPGTRSFFSSIGPTRDGRTKPEISAPGEWVGSSLSADRSAPGLDWLERDGEHWNARGTSMAAPHVAGVVALLLGINPELDGAALKSAVERSALTDSFTGTVPNNEWGHGKLRALEAVYEGSAIVTDLGVPPEGGFTGTSSPLMLSYNVYRGDLASLSESYYGDCLHSGLLSPDFTDGDPSPAGAGYFYLVTGVYSDPVTAEEIEGSMGTDGEGRTRPNNSPCP